MNNNFEYYKNYYKQQITKIKQNLQKKFDKIISLLEQLENEKIENISSLFEKVNLKFELPIEIPFIERFKISINNKLFKILKNNLFYSIYKFCDTYNCLNLFENELKDLKFIEKNPNYFETNKLKSSINYNLIGIGIPKIVEENKDSIEVKIYKGDKLLEKITKFEDNENLSIGIFDNKLEIQNDQAYSIQFKGLTNSFYINNKESYNDRTEIKLISSNENSILLCLIIE